MMWRHRFVTGQWGWELPGGIVDESEGGADAAAREVEEETGWRPGPLQHLVSYQPMPGLVDTPHEVYLARGATHVGEPSDAEEAARISWVPITDLAGLAAGGQLLGSGTLVGLLWVAASAGERERLDPPQLPD